MNAVRWTDEPGAVYHGSPFPMAPAGQPAPALPAATAPYHSTRNVFME